jgi:hypothetical protein
MLDSFSNLFILSDIARQAALDEKLAVGGAGTA